MTQPRFAGRRVAPAAAALGLLLLPLAGIGPGCSSGDGVIEGAVTVESQLNSRWILWSFDTEDVLRDGDGEPLSVDDPSAEEGWDLAFSQWVIATNSGDSAATDTVSRGALLAVEGQTDAWADFDAFTGRCSDFVGADETSNRASFGCSGVTPTVDEGYVVDITRDPDGAGPFASKTHNPSLTFWFEYDFANRDVIPWGHVYVVELRDGGCVKMQITDYYDETGDGGFVSFDWERLPD
ncbi:MAG: HmuY family protein [Deltaproteobacteria bacterium]|nr:HmuY family protein [Deltaproteobacteria bacterium]